MTASIKNILIGLFMLSAIGIIIFLLLFLHPSVGDNAKTLKVRFTDIDKVNVGTRVTFGGKPVGEVIEIREIPQARTERTNQHGDVYVYELKLAVDSGVDVFNTDQILLRTSGLLGERNIEINPQPILPGEPLQRVENEILYAAQTSSMEDTMKQVTELSKKIEVVFDDIHTILQNFQQEQIITKISKSLQNIQDITTALNAPSKLSGTLDNIYSVSNKFGKTWGTVDHCVGGFDNLALRANSSWNTLDDILRNFDEVSRKANCSWNQVDLALVDVNETARNAAAFTGKANQIMDHTLDGQGTIGELFVGDEVALRLKSILHKGEVTMGDVNSYGLLFHLDKRWQRIQGRRLRLLEQLSTPCQFAAYFNHELDQISSSLSRVGMTLNESECYPQSLIHNPQFTRRFSELLKRVENMEETLKLYNEQVISQDQTPYMNPR